MSGRGKGRGRGRGRGGDYPHVPQSGGDQGYGQGGGRGGRDGGRGRRGSFEGAAPPQYWRVQQTSPSSAASQPPPRPSPAAQQQASSSSALEAAAELSREVERKLKVDTPASQSAPAPAPARAQGAMIVATSAGPASPPPASSKATRHPARPTCGTVGRKCVIRANHFLVEVADKDVCHYDVAISPETTSRSVNRSIITELVRLYGVSHLGKRKPAYDGRKSLYTAGALPFMSKDFVIKLIDQKGDTTKEYKVAIKLAGRADLHHLRQFLLGRQMDAPQETIQALDVVLRESPSINYNTVGRSFFSPMFGHRDDIGDGLECWRGYYQSLRPTQMGLSLNMDISATSFYKPLQVIDFVAEYLNLRDMMRPLSDKDRIKIKKALRGLRVETMHRRDFCRRYKISGISSLPMNQLMFPLDEQGTRISVAQYFRERYNYSLRHVTWPCLQAGSDSRPTYLPMEVCKIMEGQRFSRKLNERQVTGILKATCQRPNMRERSIMEMISKNNYSNDEYAREFGIRVSNQLALVDARVLPPPRLKYHESGKDKFCNPNVGQWNMIGKKMVNGGAVENWTCISFSSRIGQDPVHHFCWELVKMCSNIGMTFSSNALVDFRFSRPDRLESALREVHNGSTAALARQGKGKQYLQLLIVVLPDMSGSYGKIKRLCETELGIVSQCCLPKHVSQCKPQYLENVALKINVKVGGRNTVLEDALHNRIPHVTDKPTIIFGADVTHPPPGEDSSSSIAAVVASMDWPEVTKYRGLVSAQPHRQEMIKDLFTFAQDPQRGTVNGGMIRELLIAFRQATGLRPYRIIFYRDGVSEGQFRQVLLYEMDAIRRACASLEDGYLPPVTFIVVQKRHHTRLFPMPGSHDTDRSGNILPGTVVDRQICHPTEFDFYLCSHAGIQGTSRPTHYHVLLDENCFSADELQILTNNLCYTYARCTRSVSVVPPTYYAHLAAFRARYYAEGETSDGGSASAGSAETRDRRTDVRALPRIKDNVKDVMFYC